MQTSSNSYLRSAIQFIAVAALYLVTGKTGLLLAIPPGYATAVWLPSGLALAAVLLLGYRMSLAVWLGSTVLNFWVSVERGAPCDGSTLALAAGIGVGAALSAAAGRFGMQRCVGDLALDTERSVFWFTLLGGVGACLISASNGIFMLSLYGLLPAEKVLETWWTWWVGDTIGVLTLTPVLLVYFGQPRLLWSSRRWTVAAPMSLAFTVVVLFFLQARAQEDRRRLSEFRERAAQSFQGMKNDVQITIETLRAAREFMTINPFLSAEQFEAFTQPFQARYPTGSTIGLIQRLPDEGRSAFEAQHGEIWEYGPAGRQRATPSNEYWPITYLSPSQANLKAIGFNQRSEPRRSEALRAAWQTHNLAISSRIHLAQDDETIWSEILALPIFRAGSSEKDLIGFTTLAFRVPPLVERTLADKAGEFAVAVHDVSQSGEPQALYASTTAPAHSSICYSEHLDLADHRWRVEIRPTAQYMRAHVTDYSWAVLSGGLSLVALLEVFLLILTGRTARIEQVVAERTQSLQSEIQERRVIEEALRHARDQAEAASRAKGAFLATMSHEIRTPMNGVLGYCDLLLESPLNREQLEFVRNIKISGDILLSLINDVLDFSKIEAGKMTLSPAPISLRKATVEILASLRAQAELKKLRLEFDAEADANLVVLADPTRLRQVLYNLVGNAVKFTAAGQVLVKLEDIADSPHLKVSICDTGVGITPDVQSRLFQHFTQGDSSSTRSVGGTGLGLAICKRLVEMMGGQIGLQSKPGKGSIFWFTLPRALSRPQTERTPVAETGSASAPFPNSPSGKSPCNVLLAEDNPINAMLAQVMLERMGCRVVVARNGQEAVAQAQAGGHDLILMDCQMPEMDGYEATRLIREMSSPLSAVPIIALTANAMKGDSEACLAAGMNDYLTKPISRAALQEALQRWAAVAAHS